MARGERGLQGVDDDPYRRIHSLLSYAHRAQHWQVHHDHHHLHTITRISTKYRLSQEINWFKNHYWLFKRGNFKCYQIILLLVFLKSTFFWGTSYILSSLTITCTALKGFTCDHHIIYSLFAHIHDGWQVCHNHHYENFYKKTSVVADFLFRLFRGFWIDPKNCQFLPNHFIIHDRAGGSVFCILSCQNNFIFVRSKATLQGSIYVEYVTSSQQQLKIHLRK